MADDLVPTSLFTTEVAAAPEVVWEALTSPDGVADWLGADSDLVPVAGAALDVADVETGVRRRGRVEEVEPGRRLGYVWWPAADRRGDAADGASRVTIELVPHEGGTTVVITEAPLSARAAITDATTMAWRLTTVEVALWQGARLTASC